VLALKWRGFYALPQYSRSSLLTALDTTVLDLLLVLLSLGLALIMGLWVGSLFLQNYYYTEATSGLYWKAPLASILLTGFFLVWSLMNIGEATNVAGRTQIPYGVLWEFSNYIDVISEQVPEFESKRRTSGPAIYKLDKTSPGEIRYKKVESDEYWSVMGIEYIKFKHEGQEYTFERDRNRDAGYVVFVDAQSGLEMKEFDPGRAGYASESRLVVYLLLNVIHLVLWILCFWLVLRFQFSHALGLGLVMWFVFTLTVFPGLFAETSAAAAV